jgi:hypothetical protein
MSTSVMRVIGDVVRRAVGAHGSGRAHAPDPREVRLITSQGAETAALEDRLIVNALAGPGCLPIGTLIDQVAVAVYREMLREDGSVADVGLFGARIFVPDILWALEAGNGHRWAISAPPVPAE